MNKQKCAWKRTVNRGTMKRTAIMLVIFGALFAGSPSARADSGNPFGFETNKHPLKYEYCKKEPGLFRGHGYVCSSAPRPHPDIQEYQLQFVEDVGLCTIEASFRPKHAIVFVTPSHRMFINDYDTYIANQLGEFLNKIGFERDNEDTEQLAHILGAYMVLSQNPWDDRLSSAENRLEEAAVLNDVFREMRERWPVADPSNALIQWKQHLKRLVEEDIRSYVGNTVEVFKRQLMNKYGPASPPGKITAAYEQSLRRRIQQKSSGDIIEDTRKEALARYYAGYRWESAQGFEGAGDIRSIGLVLRSEDDIFETVGCEVNIYFTLVTADTCREKIDDKANRAF